MVKSKKRAKKLKTSKKAMKKIKGVKKPAKRAVKKPGRTKEDNFEVGFEEVVIRCPSCGREFRIVKSSGFSTEGMLCQRCAAGGGIGFEEDSDF